MYKLYLNNGIITQIDKSEEIQDFIYTMGSYIKDNPESRFIIKEQNKEKGDTARCINGIMEYARFVEEQKTCVELKKEITKDVKVKRLKK